MKLRDLAEQLHCRLEGDGDIDIARVAALETAGPGVGDLPGQREIPRQGRAHPRERHHRGRHPDGRALRDRAVRAAGPSRLRGRCRSSPPNSPPPANIDPSAVVDASAVIDADASIGALACIGAAARVGARTVVHPFAYVGPEAHIGADCVVHVHVLILASGS